MMKNKYRERMMEMRKQEFAIVYMRGGRTRRAWDSDPGAK